MNPSTRTASNCRISRTSGSVSGWRQGSSQMAFVTLAVWRYPVRRLRCLALTEPMKEFHMHLKRTAFQTATVLALARNFFSLQASA